MADFKDIVRLFRSLSEDDNARLAKLSDNVDQEDVKQIERWVKQKKVRIVEDDPSNSLVQYKDKPIRLEARSSDKIVQEKVDALNNSISEINRNEMFAEFSKKITTLLPDMISPEIVGFKDIKRAVAIQLFSKDHLHILMLGDPGTGKTKILKSATDIHPISSMGLGSGTSGAGLAVTMRGNEVIPGLLPMADKGLCAIDELNLMKDDSKASLYNAMESGFVSYDKGGHHHKFNARVSVLATANPKGDKFKGSNPDELKEQLPFDPALLSRFHLVFLVRRPGVSAFKDISRNILSGRKKNSDQKDIEFLQEYLNFANGLKEPTLPKMYEKEIVDFVGTIKENEDQYLIEVSPRLVVGFIRMVKALARSELRSEVEDKDISAVKAIVESSLKIN